MGKSEIYKGYNFKCVWSDPDRPLYLYLFDCNGVPGKVSVFLTEPISTKSVILEGILAPDPKNPERYRLNYPSILPYVSNNVWEAYRFLGPTGLFHNSTLPLESFEKALPGAFISLLPDKYGQNTEALAEKFCKNIKTLPSDIVNRLNCISCNELACRCVLSSYGFEPSAIKSAISAISSMAGPIKSSDMIFAQATTEIDTNPYRLIYNYDFSFDFVDTRVMSSGRLPFNDRRRKDAYLDNGVKFAEMSSGSTLFPPEDIIAASKRASKVNISEILPADVSCAASLSNVDGKFIRNTTLEMETQFFKFIQELANDESLKCYLKDTFVPPKRGSATKEQYAAILNVGVSPVSIITGGPGCGKTFTINALISQIEDTDDNLLLLAPTGKAAQRLSEVTGKFASTIHYFSTSGRFASNLEDSTGLTVVVDEASMLSSETAALLSGVLKDLPIKRLIFVGDTNQLPSVGAGNVLQAMISCGKIPVSRLTKVKRQSNTSSIAQIARGMLDGLPINKLRDGILPNSKEDIYFSKFPTDRDPIDSIYKAITSGRIKKFVKDFDPIRDFQLLCPMKRGPNGVFNANLRLQSLLNPEKSPLEPRAPCGTKLLPYSVRVGDKILCTKNNYELGVVNGDIGVVTEIKPNYLRANITGSGNVRLPKNFFSSIELGYATTVHKSQGSESPVVVTLLPPAHTQLYQRNLLYTAITRSRTLQWVFANEFTLNACIQNDNALRRESALDYMLSTGITYSAKDSQDKSQEVHAKEYIDR